MPGNNQFPTPERPLSEREVEVRDQNRAKAKQKIEFQKVEAANRAEIFE